MTAYEKRIIMIQLRANKESNYNYYIRAFGNSPLNFTKSNFKLHPITKPFYPELV